MEYLPGLFQYKDFFSGIKMKAQSFYNPCYKIDDKPNYDTESFVLRMSMPALGYIKVLFYGLKEDSSPPEIVKFSEEIHEVCYKLQEKYKDNNIEVWLKCPTHTYHKISPAGVLNVLQDEPEVKNDSFIVHVCNA